MRYVAAMVIICVTLYVAVMLLLPGALDALGR